jgi:hypothetical protein
MARFLLKYATRNRPELFCKTLGIWIDKLSGLHTTHIIVSVDSDDYAMQTPLVRMAMSNIDPEKRVKVSFYTGPHTNKVTAINRDMEHAGDFDVLVVVSDDMVPLVDRYDEIVFNDMEKHHPNGFGALHYDDGSTNHQLCTLSIMDKQMYDHFGYIYHPDYKMLWCDNEFMDVARGMNKLPFIDRVIIEHQYKRHGNDAVYDKSESKYQEDRRTYLFRKENGWPK